MAKYHRRGKGSWWNDARVSWFCHILINVQKICSSKSKRWFKKPQNDQHQLFSEKHWWKYYWWNGRFGQLEPQSPTLDCPCLTPCQADVWRLCASWSSKVGVWGSSIWKPNSKPPACGFNCGLADWQRQEPLTPLICQMGPLLIHIFHHFCSSSGDSSSMRCLHLKWMKEGVGVGGVGGGVCCCSLWIHDYKFWHSNDHRVCHHAL